MTNIKLLSTLTIGAVLLTACVSPVPPKPPINNNTSQASINTNQNPAVQTQQAIIKTNLGDITIELFTSDSPKTVENFITLAKSGFYDDTRFHRVIKDFMIQAGDPLSKDLTKKSIWGTGGPDYRFADEFNSHKLVRGSLAMANAGPNTNGSQFFIVTAESTPWLDGKHTNFGQVISGMEVVDIIEGVKTEGPDRPISDVTILSITLQ